MNTRWDRAESTMGHCISTICQPYYIQELQTFILADDAYFLISAKDSECPEVLWHRNSLGQAYSGLYHFDYPTDDKPL